MRKILFIVNVDWFFVSHRLPIAIEAINQGYEVHIATTLTDKLDLLEQNGLIVHSLDMHRSRAGISTLYELWNFFSIMRSIGPDIVHLVTAKPLLLGGIAARLAGVPALVLAVSGLGIVFSSDSFKHKILRHMLRPFYYLAFGHKNYVAIFQNKDDLQSLLSWKVTSVKRSIIIYGSGVDLDICTYLPEPEGIPVVSFASRLLVDKGVEVFVRASEVLRNRGVNVRFWLIGEPDLGNANAVTKEQLRSWESSGFVELLGHREDISDLFSRSNIVILPSFYGEGLPKVLVEAAACGRAVITTDHPGCRDAIEPGKTGLLVPVRDPVGLADAISALIENSKRRQKMGELGRKRAESMFDIKQVVSKHIHVYKALLDEVID